MKHALPIRVERPDNVLLLERRMLRYQMSERFLMNEDLINNYDGNGSHD